VCGVGRGTAGGLRGGRPGWRAGGRRNAVAAQRPYTRGWPVRIAVDALRGTDPAGGAGGLRNAVAEQRPYMRQPNRLARGRCSAKWGWRATTLRAGDGQEERGWRLTRLAGRVGCGTPSPRNDPICGSKPGWPGAGGRQNAVAEQRPWARETARRSAHAYAAGGEGWLRNAVSEQRPYMRQPTWLARGRWTAKMPLPSNDPLHGRWVRRSAAGRLRGWWGAWRGGRIGERRPRATTLYAAASPAGPRAGGRQHAVAKQRPYTRETGRDERNDPIRGSQPSWPGLADAKVRSPRNDPVRGAWLVQSRLPSSVPRRMLGTSPAMTARGTALPSAADLRVRRGGGHDDAATASGQRQERCVSIGTTPAAPCQAVPRRQAPDQPTPDQPTPDQPATARRRGATGWQSSV